MSVIETTIAMWKFNRDRTLATLDDIAKFEDPQAVLGWRPGPERAHIAWQIMHIGVTEELFATERLAGTTAKFADLIPRFRGGSTPDDDIPSLDSIRDVLNTSREDLIERMNSYSDNDLDEIPEAFKERGWTLGMCLQVIAWHEGHHQGQAHITLNLYRAAHT